MKGSLFSTQVAEPYAQALMSLAQSQQSIESLGEDCRSLLELWNNSPDLREFINSPVTNEENKKAVLRRVLGDNANTYLTNFIMLLIDKRRLVYLPEICQQYLALLRKLTNTVLAEVSSAQALSEEQRSAVCEKIKQLTQAQSIELQTTVDPDLIGGVVIKVGSQVFDASLRGQLRRISLNLGGAS
ncbi:ATP synthase F1 subunit delta [Aphanothece sacrum]|uniref:ATP synthase subunit delta n=1 Tax=Aphanothece sacrum FPU1 TaxID=1920663 RepID=A0A401IG11_APHSA|nr:ATP synthase F1 subunit delta [Aphanothece sacrum]GBF80151.1 ATP synthase subunit delta [Aphanothece sacrum FPU1]GBF86398.1 ATP synthase subunit delta [Aphanothece sacrum FPU3]